MFKLLILRLLIISYLAKREQKKKVLWSKIMISSFDYDNSVIKW